VVLLILLFWGFAFALTSVRGVFAGEIPFHLIGPHRFALMAFSALLCWLALPVLEAARPRSFTDRALLGLGASTAMAAFQSLFHMASCRLAPIDGYAPVTAAEAVSSGMVSLAFFLAWTWMHFALVAQRMSACEEPPQPARAAEERVFWVSRGRQHARVRASDLLWAEAQRDYVMLHAIEGGGGMLRETLGGLQAELDAGVFVRVHRSAIVRRSAVVAVRRKASGALALTLSNGDEVPVGRSYASGVRALVAEIDRGG
jgi:DNA-binding LytR/AlgR family response regulator